MNNELAVEHNHHNQADETDVFGFWLYIMTDCILFGCLFATFIVLNGPHAPGPALRGYLNLYDVLIETFLLLASNFTFCLAALSLMAGKLRQVQAWLFATFLLGAAFIYMEVTEFIHLAAEGFKPSINGAASSFFTLVGTHGVHVAFGLIWILLMIIQIPLLEASHITKRRMTCLGLFWNFLDVIWIFIFTIVYLTGALQHA